MENINLNFTTGFWKQNKKIYCYGKEKKYSCPTHMKKCRKNYVICANCMYAKMDGICIKYMFSMNRANYANFLRLVKCVYATLPAFHITRHSQPRRSRYEPQKVKVNKKKSIACSYRNYTWMKFFQNIGTTKFFCTMLIQFRLTRTVT